MAFALSFFPDLISAIIFFKSSIAHERRGSVSAKEIKISRTEFNVFLINAFAESRMTFLWKDNSSEKIKSLQFLYKIFSLISKASPKISSKYDASIVV